MEGSERERVGNGRRQGRNGHVTTEDNGDVEVEFDQAHYYVWKDFFQKGFTSEVKIVEVINSRFTWVHFSIIFQNGSMIQCLSLFCASIGKAKAKISPTKHGY